MTAPITADHIRQILNLEPLPVEGGYFRRTYESDLTINVERGKRHAGTAIYFLLEAGIFSEMHVLSSDELFHFYLGDPVEMLQLWPDGRSTVVTMGSYLQAGQQLQLLVPAGVWQGTRLIGDGQIALLGCSVVPGFEYEDYENAGHAELSAKWPKESAFIRALTRT